MTTERNISESTFFARAIATRRGLSSPHFSTTDGISIQYHHNTTTPALDIPALDTLSKSIQSKNTQIHRSPKHNWVINQVITQSKYTITPYPYPQINPSHQTTEIPPHTRRGLKPPQTTQHQNKRSPDALQHATDPFPLPMHRLRTNHTPFLQELHRIDREYPVNTQPEQYINHSITNLGKNTQVVDIHHTNTPRGMPPVNVRCAFLPVVFFCVRCPELPDGGRISALLGTRGYEVARSRMNWGTDGTLNPIVFDLVDGMAVLGVGRGHVLSEGAPVGGVLSPTVGGQGEVGLEVGLNIWFILPILPILPDIMGLEWVVGYPKYMLQVIEGLGVMESSVYCGYFPTKLLGAGEFVGESAGRVKSKFPANRNMLIYKALRSQGWEFGGVVIYELINRLAGFAEVGRMCDKSSWSLVDRRGSGRFAGVRARGGRVE